MPLPAAIVIGVGAEAGLGATLCRRFAREGHHVLAVGRSPDRLSAVVAQFGATGGSAEAVPADATSEAAVAALFAGAFAPSEIHDAPDLVVFNAGANQPIKFLALEANQFESFWRVGCFAGFLVGREAARHMVPLGRGTILFTGASASLRGKPEYAHFAAAKAGLRMISQSMAREFGPLGLHVGHIVIDGGIDGDVLRKRWPDVVGQRGDDGLLKLEAVAESYWHLSRQDPSAWTQEIDLRPFKENF
jgi:NAD(P)-dependent dehydrogenase (short-subunit alcohol dehydrogenase family)